MDDASRYIAELRETNPKKAATLEGVISVATGGPLKAAIGKGVEVGLDQSGLGEKVAEQTKKVTDPILEAAASGIAGYNPTLDEFRANMEETGADGDEARLKGGTEFFVGSVLGIAGSVGGKGKDSNDSTVGANGNAPYTGGAHKETSQPIGDGFDSHHCPAKSCYKNSPISSENGPAIKMEPGDHRKTASYGSSPEARAYREKQKELIDQGRVVEAIQMDIDDLRSKFGNKYDAAIKEMESYLNTLNPEDFINR